MHHTSFAVAHCAKGELDGALRTYEFLVQENPTSLWAWWGLCNVHFATNHSVDGAIMACQNEIAKSHPNPSPALVLIDLYSAYGDYREAISTYMDLCNSYGDHKKLQKDLLLAFLEFGKSPGFNKHGKPESDIKVSFPYEPLTLCILIPQANAWTTE